MVSNYKSLAIVGNGFDLQLGIKSRFVDFANSVHFPELDDFKKLCDDLVTDDDTVDTTRIEYWSSFEERINQITYVRSPVADMSFDCEKARKELEIINRDYCIIKHELIAYLRMASKKNRYIIDSVKDVINNQTMIINFNYTDTFEEYSNNIFYVHGSINENNIVLRYDDRGERCMSQALDVRWRKNICRERLEYTRYLKRVLGLVPNDEEYKKYIEALAIYLNYRDTPRGIDSENQKEIPMFKDIKKVLCLL